MLYLQYRLKTHTKKPVLEQLCRNSKQNPDLINCSLKVSQFNPIKTAWESVGTSKQERQMCSPGVGTAVTWFFYATLKNLKENKTNLTHKVEIKINSCVQQCMKGTTRGQCATCLCLCTRPRPLSLLRFQRNNLCNTLFFFKDPTCLPFCTTLLN